MGNVKYADVIAYIAQHSAYAMRCTVDTLAGAVIPGIYPGDVLIIDRLRQAWPGCIVVSAYQGKYHVRRYAGDGDDDPVWGVVTFTVRH